MTPKISPRQTQLLTAVAFLILVPLICHLLFSWMGFTPTDEGATLAHSRRIVDGLVPHRDFIMIRPFVWPLIHTPIVLFGGNYTFWLSRLFVWCQLSLIAWLWVSVIGRLVSFRFSATNKLLIALMAFAASVHTKHLTAWPTIDGLLFIAIGIALITRPARASKLTGYFIIGLSPLCKQNFAFLVPVSLIILGDWRQLRFWIAAGTPALLYLVFLVLADSFVDGLRQLASAGSLVPIIIGKYPVMAILLSIAAGYAAASFTQPRSASSSRINAKVAISLLYVLPVLCAGVSLFLGTWASTSFALFGLSIGVGAFLFRNVSGRTGEKQVYLLSLTAAFCASLSGGYTSPALASGPLLAALVLSIFTRYLTDYRRLLSRSLWVAAIVIVLAFGWARTRYIYRDLPASQLDMSLADVLPGGRLIYTNRNTYQFMKDLKIAVEFVESSGKEYAIITDGAAYWVKARQRNPLPAVWSQELSPPLMNKFVSAMESKRGSTIFIVQKVQASSLASGFAPLTDTDDYAAVRYARTHFTKIYETNFFALYQ